MIDEYWTWIFYGYHSDELKSRSGKKVVARCDECCQYRILSMHDYNDLCLSCSHSGCRSYMYGRTGDKCVMYGRIGDKHPAYVKRSEDIFCDNCGEQLFRRPKAVGKRNFCNRKCFAEFRYGKGAGLYVYTNEQNIIKSVKRVEFFSDRANREKLSAAIQGIPYDEWEGFAKDELYCPLFNEKCRESNREKYDRQCFLCGQDEFNNIDKNGNMRKLSVHHVNMNKDQGCNNHEWKLVPLCMHCHASAHGGAVMNRIIYILNSVWNKGDVI